MLDKREAREIAVQYMDRVRQVYKPKQVIIFGSFVNGNPHTDSDIDIAVVFDKVEGDWLETWGGLISLPRAASISCLEYCCFGILVICKRMLSKLST